MTFRGAALTALSAIAIAMLAAACAPGEAGSADSGNPSARSAMLGAIAPALEASLLDGTPVALDSLRGAPVLLNVWATWCHPCRDEIPVLEELHQRHAGQGLRVVGVSIDDAGRVEDVRNFAREFGVTYDVWHDPDQRVMPAFSVIGVPTTYLLGADGRVIWRKTGEVKAGDPALSAALDSALTS